MKYSDIFCENARLAAEMKDQEKYSIALLANITVNQVKEIFEYQLRSKGINALVEVGNYDNIVQDSTRFKSCQLVLVFWEVANLIDGLQYKGDLMTDLEINEILVKVKGEISLVLDNLKSIPSVVWNKFSTVVFNSHSLRSNNFDRIRDELNKYLESKKSSNVTVIDIEKIFANISIEKAVDFRFYYSSKALYTVDFLKAYVEFILPIPLSLNGRIKKALILDCDNTLWKGILGEDGIYQLAMSSRQKGGTPYEEVQCLAKASQKRGILLCLCSKNNAADIDEVLEKNPNMTIQNQDLTLKYINWDDKVSNLKKIQKILNIGLDSLVYIDDSDFELEYINQALPDVTTVRVPDKIYSYPMVVRRALNLFYSQSLSTEDSRRGVMYQEQSKREEIKQKFNTLNEYLRALEIHIDIFINEREFVSRISQMTQKTNQFNLTTKRYSEMEILSFMNSSTSLVYAISVADKFGDSGLTGLAIVHQINHTAQVDTFLMSCRIIGRSIEYAFFDSIIAHLKQIRIKRVVAEYIKTMKNDQVMDFYEKLGFRIVGKNASSAKYELEIDSYKESGIDYIHIKHGK